MPQYAIAARTINEERLSLAHVHTFNMDEYANEDGVTAPLSWPGSFQRAMWERFFDLVDPDLRPPEEQIHFPTTEAIGDYSKRIEDLGGADVCYGGIGWCGHIAFWESHLGLEFDGDLEAYKQAGARLVELHPMTIMQNALHSFGGDWSWVPPRANTIGPREILGARHRSFWLDGDLGGGVSWQRFIARLVAHGPVSELVPGSILQTAPHRLHDPRQRRRRRRDPHGVSIALVTYGAERDGASADRDRRRLAGRARADRAGHPGAPRPSSSGASRTSCSRSRRRASPRSSSRRCPACASRRNGSPSGSARSPRRGRSSSPPGCVPGSVPGGARR